MFKLLKKSASNKVVDAESKQQNQYPEIVTEIHKEFDTAGEKLLQQAIEILDDCKLKDKKKGKLLFQLGFINTPQAKEVQEIEQKEKLAQENADLIKYYSEKYPFNKFVSEEIMEQICKKYKLVCGNVSLYKGFVPADKLKLIADFKINSKDTAVNMEYW